MTTNEESTDIQIVKPVVYDDIEGIEELSKQYDNDKRYNSILVSQMVAEFMMNNKHKYSDLDYWVLVPNTDPKYVVRDAKGAIVGVRSLINYGKLK